MTSSIWTNCGTSFPLAKQMRRRQAKSGNVSICTRAQRSNTELSWMAEAGRIHRISRCMPMGGEVRLLLSKRKYVTSRSGGC